MMLTQGLNSALIEVLIDGVEVNPNDTLLTRRTMMTYRLTYSDGREWGSLTTARAESRYGIPVLIIEGRAYGPADIVSPPWSPLGPNTEIFCRPTFAGGLVASWGSGSRSPEEKRAAACRG